MHAAMRFTNEGEHRSIRETVTSVHLRSSRPGMVKTRMLNCQELYAEDLDSLSPFRDPIHCCAEVHHIK